MTHTQWEHGETLTVHNATKEQLKFMVEDKQSTICRLDSELQEAKKNNKKLLESLISLSTYISVNLGDKALAEAMKF